MFGLVPSARGPTGCVTLWARTRPLERLVTAPAPPSAHSFTVCEDAPSAWVLLALEA